MVFDLTIVGGGNLLIRGVIMIIFIENRQLVVDGYKTRFKKAGEALVRLSCRDVVDWMSSSSYQELASVEAIFVGQVDNTEIIMPLLRNKLDVPVIALLDNRSLEQTITFYRQGVDDVVTKPVHYEELLIRVAAIKKRMVQPVEQVSKESIVVYFDGRDPEVAGDQIVLPRRERRILEYLAGINGRRASKSQIFGAIYGVFDEQIEENVVESHISKLRKKLRGILGHDPIDSKRYLGYRLDPTIVRAEKNISQVLVA